MIKSLAIKIKVAIFLGCAIRHSKMIKYVKLKMAQIAFNIIMDGTLHMTEFIQVH
jgi:hypothetical protein